MNRFTYNDIIKDIINGLRQWHIWSVLAWSMIKMQYRRTIIGPFWITLQQAVFVVVLGYIFAGIQKEHFPSFFVFFASGYTVWMLISSFVTSAGNTFMGINGLPNMTQAALSCHIYLQFATQILLFAHKAIPLVIILSLFHNTVSISFPHLIYGFFMLMVFGFWISALLGCLSLRFQDLKPAMTSIMQVMFFLTPVMFNHSRIPGGELIANYNPFYHILVVVRGNLINDNVTLLNYIAVLVINIMGIGVTLWVLRRSRPKLAYWVG